jgi:uncharacterized membrane protein
MARNSKDVRLDAPKGMRAPVLVPRRRQSSDRFGRFTEWIARAMGTPWFLMGLTVFCFAWVLYNTLAPEDVRFDSAALGFTALTLILSLQASYAAPLILLAQNRQDDLAGEVLRVRQELRSLLEELEEQKGDATADRGGSTDRPRG